MKKGILGLVIALLTIVAAKTQNVGVGTPNPSEKLEVNGVIYSNTGGVKFPDSTVQTTAAYSNDVPNDDVLDRITIGMKITSNTISIDGDFTINGMPDLTKILYHNTKTQRVFDVSIFTPGGNGAGIASFENIFITKNIDGNSPVFINYMMTARPIDEIELFFTKDTPGPPDHIYQTITYQNCVLSSVDQTYEFDPKGGYIHLERISFVAEKFCIESFDENGNSVNSYGWDFSTNSFTSCN